MITAWLRPALVPLLLCSLPATAWAGGGGGSDTGPVGSDTGPIGTDTGTGSDTGTDTGTGTGTDTGTGTGSDSGTTMGECSECADSTDVVRIVSPEDGATVAGTFDVHILAPYTCECVGCACAPRPPFTVNLRVDGETVINCANGEKECNTEDQTFTIELAPGTYTLDAVADHDGQPEFSDPVVVTVPGAADDSTGSPPPPPPPPPASTDEGGSDSTGAPAADGGGGGCGCHADPHRSRGGLLLGLAALLGLGRLRRRRG